MRPASERRALAIVVAALVIDSTGFGIAMPVMPDLIVSLTHSSLSAAAPIGGALLGVFAAMQFLFGPVMGGLGDRYGRRPVILFSMLAFGLDYIVMGLAPNLAWLFASRAMAGIAGAIFVPAAAYIADVTPPERRASSYGLVGAAFGAGFVIGPALGGLLGGLGTRVPFLVAGGLALLNAALGSVLLPESLPVERRRPFSIARANPFGTFRALGRHRGIAPLFVAWFLWMLSHLVYPSTWSFFAKLRFGWDQRMIGISLAYTGAITTLAQVFVTRRAVPALGEHRAALLGMAFGLTGFLGNAFVPQGWMVFPVMTVAAFQGLVYPSFNSTLSRRVAPDQQGELQGGVASLMSIASIVGPVASSQTLGYFTGPRAPVHFAGAAFALSSLFTMASMAVVAWGARRAFAAPVAAEAVPGG
jgi:DHA1 family tetracycline resistance protein-like MFS transporter